MSNLTVFKSTVSTVLRNVNNGAPDPSIDQPQGKKSWRLHLQTPPKVKNFIASDSLIPQREMLKSIGVSQRSITCLIHGPSKQRKLKKPCPTYNLIKDGQYESIWTMDEVMLSSLWMGWEFLFRFENRPKGIRFKTGRHTFAKQRMFAAGYSWRGPTRLFLVDKTVKNQRSELFEQILLYV